MVACLEEYVNRTELIRKNLEANNEEFIQFMPIRISLTIRKNNCNVYKVISWTF